MVAEGGTGTAVVAVSRPGCELALRLQRGLPDVTLFLPELFTPAASADVHRWSAPLRELIGRLFAEYRGLVLFGSVGMAVRLIAPLVRGKRTDPAVVVVDDGGQFTVSILSGHLGGANALAARVADVLHARSVITTASDALGTVAVDLLGQEFGWRIEHGENVTRVSAALVNGDVVGLCQETGERDWWPGDKALPPNLVCFSTLDALAASGCQAALIITDRTLGGWEGTHPPIVIYRPRSLVVGIGCNRGTTAEELASTVSHTIVGHGLARASIRNLATLDLKRNEAGLGELAATLDIPVAYFSAEELDGVPVPNPSATVRRWVETRGVCEPAALLSSGAQTLAVPKVTTPNVTVAVARVDFSRARGAQW